MIGASSWGWGLVAAAAFLAAGGVRSNDECRNSSYPDLCLSMVTSGEYKTDYDLSLGMFIQAREHIIAAQDDIGRAKSQAGGNQARLSYLEGCKQEYAVALKEMEACIDRFTDTMEPLYRDTYVNNLGNTSTHVYRCVLSHKKYESQFPLDDCSIDLSKRMFNTYDLGTRSTYLGADMIIN